MVFIAITVLQHSQDNPPISLDGVDFAKTKYSQNETIVEFFCWFVRINLHPYTDTQLPHTLHSYSVQRKATDVPSATMKPMTLKVYTEVKVLTYTYLSFRVKN